MATFLPPAGNATWVKATGFTVITSANAQILGVGFCGTTSGSVQFFAGVTSSVSLLPIMRANNVATATSPGAVYLPVPAVVSGAGLTVNVPATTDPNVIIYWLPVGGP